MSEGSRPNNNYTSEASRMLEAALEQMDGIIQGAKYELPNYFDNFSIQVISCCKSIKIFKMFYLTLGISASEYLS